MNHLNQTFYTLKDEYKNFLELAHPLVKQWKTNNQQETLEIHELTNNFSLMLYSDGMVGMTWTEYVLEEYTMPIEVLPHLIEEPDALFNDVEPNITAWFLTDEAIEFFKSTYYKNNVANGKVTGYQLGGHCFCIDSEYGFNKLGTDHFEIKEDDLNNFANDVLNHNIQWFCYETMDESRFEYKVKQIDKNGTTNWIELYDFCEACKLVDTLKRTKAIHERTYIVDVCDYLLYF